MMETFTLTCKICGSHNVYVTVEEEYDYNYDEELEYSHSIPVLVCEECGNEEYVIN